MVQSKYEHLGILFTKRHYKRHYSAFISHWIPVATIFYIQRIDSQYVSYIIRRREDS